MGTAWRVTLFYGRVGYQPKDSFPSTGSAGKQTLGRYFLHLEVFSRVVCHLVQIRIHCFGAGGKKPTSFNSGPGTFTLKFKRSDMKDRRPTPSEFSVSPDPTSIVWTASSPTIMVSRQYSQPPPKRQMNLDNPDVQTMLYGYMGYRQGRESLPSMAYFCCEVFFKRLGKGINHAGDKHKIRHKLINKVKNLASNKGGDQGRHSSAIDCPLTHVEIQLLEKVVEAMIIRGAMVAANPDQAIDFIDGGNILEMSP